MKFIQKQYKADRFIDILQKDDFYLYQTGNCSTQKNVELMQIFEKEKIKVNKTQNNLLKKLFKNNNYNFLNKFFQGSLIIAYPQMKEYPIQNLLKILPNLTFCCINKKVKFYNKKELEKSFLNENKISLNILLPEYIKILSATLLKQ
jgi:hypothetical protein